MHAGGTAGAAFRKDHDGNTGKVQTVSTPRRPPIKARRQEPPKAVSKSCPSRQGKTSLHHHAGTASDAGEARPGGGQGHVSAKPGPRMVWLEALAAFLTAIPPPRTAGTRHPRLLRHRLRRTARALGFGSCPRQGTWRCLRGHRHRPAGFGRWWCQTCGLYGNDDAPCAFQGSRSGWQEARGRWQLPGRLWCTRGSPSPGRAATHLASPQIRVTVPSSKSSTVTATSSELVCGA